MDYEALWTRMRTMVLHKTKKTLLSRRIVVAILIGIFVAVIMGYAAKNIEPGLDPLDEGAYGFDLLILSFFMPVVAMIYGSSILRDDIEDKSITAIITSPMGRLAAYVGYYISLTITLSIVMLGITSAGFIAYFSQTGGGGLGGLYLSMCGLVILGSMVYSVVFLAFGVVLEKPMYLGLFFAFIWEGFIGSIPGSIGKLSIKYYIRSVGSSMIDHGGLAHFKGADAASSFLGLILLLIVFLALGAFLFEEKEIA